MPSRIQLSRRKGWTKPEGAIVVARPSIFGNPFKADVWGLEMALKLYEDAMMGRGPHIDGLPEEAATEVYLLNIAFRKKFSVPPACRAIQVLRGRDLCCWCPLSRRCHADILLRISND
jgi:hypothetical protein